jgi:hypothetical protein
MKPEKPARKNQLHRTAAARTKLLCFAGTLLALALTGCANLPTNLVAAGTVNVERLDSSNARIRSVFGGDKDGLLLVRGHLEKRYFGRGRIPGHLHIEVLGEGGSMLGEQVTRYYRQSGRSSISRFSRKFSVHPGEVRTVRVIHHRRDDDADAGKAGPVPGASRGPYGSVQPV